MKASQATRAPTILEKLPSIEVGNTSSIGEDHRTPGGLRFWKGFLSLRANPAQAHTRRYPDDSRPVFNFAN